MASTRCCFLRGFNDPVQRVMGVAVATYHTRNGQEQQLSDQNVEPENSYAVWHVLYLIYRKYSIPLFFCQGVKILDFTLLQIGLFPMNFLHLAENFIDICHSVYLVEIQKRHRYIYGCFLSRQDIFYY